MNVDEAIRSKRAIRDYKSRPLSSEAIRTILNAGRLSQSAKNIQPWHFVAIQDRERLQTLAVAGQFSAHLGEAALGVVILTPDPAERFQILFDTGQAAAYMQLAAWELGIGSCLVTSYNRAGVQALLAIPADFHVRVAIAFGYPALAGQTRKSAKVGRRPFADVVHWESW